MAKLWLSLGAIYGFLGVVFGAFGAHALKGKLTPEALQTWGTAVQYQFYHALALVMVGVLVKQAAGAAAPWLTWAGVAFAVGVLFFSGSLYGLALGGPRILGPITPLGGVMFMVGWGLVLWHASKA